jgi:acetyl-CoA synthetase
MRDARTYDELYRNFRWEIPATFNIGVDVSDKWADAKNKLALIYVGPDEKEQRFTFKDLKVLSNRLANALKAHGTRPGDRVGILLP